MLAKIPGDRTRGRWIERCLDAGWTTRELGQQLTGERRESLSNYEHGGGRAARNAVGVALTECAQNASRANVQLRVALEALQSRLRDEGDVDEGLLERAIRENEELRAQADATLACLRGTGRTSTTRICLAPNGAATTVPSTRPPAAARLRGEAMQPNTPAVLSAAPLHDCSEPAEKVSRCEHEQEHRGALCSPWSRSVRAA
jgi:hypothetical protein